MSLGLLLHVGPARTKVGIHLSTDVDVALFDPSSMAIRGDCFHKAGLRISDIALEVSRQGGFICLNRQEAVDLRLMHQVHQRHD